MPRRFIVIAMLLVFGVIAIIYFLNARNNVYYQTQTDGGSVAVGTREDGKVKADVTFKKWEDETSLKLSYPVDPEITPVEENGVITWKDDEKEVYFKEIPKEEETFVTPTGFEDTKKIDYIGFGSVPLSTLTAAYELPSNMGFTRPTLLSFKPNNDGYVFYGGRPVESNLKHLEDNSYPIVRIKPSMDSACPVIPSSANGTIAATLYYPQMPEHADRFEKAFVDAMNQVLRARGIETEIEKRADSLYYMDGIVPKMLGRIVNDETNVTFYLYITNPYETGLSDHLRDMVVLRDTVLAPYASLKDIDSSITVDFLDEVIGEFGETAGYGLDERGLSEEEKQQLQKLQGVATDVDWIEAALYPSDTGDDFDKFEFDILLKEKPQENVFTYQIDTEGLEFYYQPELTEQEKEDGFVRPDNVVGSYAVYHQSQNNVHFSVVEAEKYRTGKAFHIYRPKIIAADGEWIWGVLNVDEEKGILSVTVDPAFLESAAYPVIVDPTLGYITAGASSVYLEVRFHGSEFAGSYGIASSMTAYVSEDDAGSFAYAFYTHNDGGSSDLVGRTDFFSPSTIKAADWRTLTLQSNANITDQDDYILGARAIDNIDKHQIYFDSGTTNQGHDAGVGTGTNIDSTASFSHENTNKYSIYVTYTEVDTPTPIPTNTPTPTPTPTPTNTPTPTPVPASGTILEGGTTIRGGTTLQ